MIIQKLKNFQAKAAPLRLSFFLFILAIIWMPFAILFSLLLQANPNLATIITMGLLFIFFYSYKNCGENTFISNHLFFGNMV
jgi:hypothetical protein